MDKAINFRLGVCVQILSRHTYLGIMFPKMLHAMLNVNNMSICRVSVSTALSVIIPLGRSLIAVDLFLTH